MKPVRILQQMISIVALTGACAHAAPVYEQAPAVQPSTGWTSHQGVGQGGFQTFDDFSLGSDTAIQRVTWRGTYLTADNNGLHGASPNTDSWTVEFWSGNAAGPSTRLFSQSYAAADVQRSAAGSSPFAGSQIDLFDFAIDLGTDFDADANVQYWFSVRSNAASFSPFFSWTNSDAAGDTYQTLNDAQGNTVADFVRGGSRAFALYNNVPEPASLALVMAALLAAPAFGARRRAGQ